MTDLHVHLPERAHSSDFGTAARTSWRIIGVATTWKVVLDLTAQDDQRTWTWTIGSSAGPAPAEDGLEPAKAPTPVEHKAAVPLPRRSLLDRDWQALVVLLTLLASLAVHWVLWRIVSPILHTLVLFALAAVLAFALEPTSGHADAAPGQSAGCRCRNVLTG